LKQAVGIIKGKKSGTMKLQRIGLLLFLIFLAVVSFLFTQRLSAQEKKHKTQEFLQKGNHLVGLLSIYPIRDVDEDKRDFFFRVLSEYASEGLVYFYIHDHAGQIVLLLNLDDSSSAVPSEIQTKSLYSMGLTRQVYVDNATGKTVYEFSKPIFENGKKTGTLRLGLQLPPISLFSLERLSLLAMIAFFIVCALALGYYGVTQALKPLRQINLGFKSTCVDPESGENEAERSGQIAPIIEGLEESLTQIKEKLNIIERDNVELSSRLSVTAFEKNQIIKILDTINFGIIITDIQENVSNINDYMLKLLNKKLEDVIDQPFEEIIEHPEVASFIAQQEMHGQAKTVSHIEVTFPELAPGEAFRVSSSYLMGGENTPIGLMISTNNITAENMVETGQQDFIAHVAHELLTPLTNIKSYSEMLMDGEIDDIEMQKEFYNTINEQTDRLTNLIRNLLNISKMEMGSLSLTKGIVKTDWLVEDCTSTIEGSARDKSITIVKDLPDMFPSMMADKELLKVAVNNILGNAVKYTPEGGDITFSISEQDKMVIITVRDSGYGISDEELPKIFEKFYRSENPQITEQAGSGLGLATTVEIVHLHDGEVDVQSDIGQGTQFTIRIPKEEYSIGKR